MLKATLPLFPLLAESFQDTHCAEFISQLLLWSIEQHCQIPQLYEHFGQEIAQISQDQFRFLPKKQDRLYEYDQEHWQRIPATVELETYGLLLVRTDIFEHMSTHHRTTISHACAYVLQTIISQRVMEQRMNMTSYEAKDLLKQLTPQEQKILCAMVLGKSKETIAETMNLSRRTVETHQRNIYQKLSVTSGTDAIIITLLGNVDILCMEIFFCNNENI